MSRDDAIPPPPMPDCDIPRFDPVVAAVQADLSARSALGIVKYGCTLEGLPVIAAVRHAYEEALYLANYLKRTLMALEGQ